MPDKSFVETYFNDAIDRLTDKRIENYTQTYATQSDGTVNQPLADHIHLELKRRATLGKTLDIVEPLTWAGVSALLSTAAAAGLKYSRDKAVARPALWGLLGASALSSAIQLARIPLRFNMAYKGGLDVALAMHDINTEKEMPPQLADKGWCRKLDNEPVSDRTRGH